MTQILDIILIIILCLLITLTWVNAQNKEWGLTFGGICFIIVIIGFIYWDKELI